MNEINLSLFGGRLKETRKALGLNQADAADLVGVSREHWGRCERGLGLPGSEVLGALANAGADVRYLLTGQRDFSPPPHLSAEEETMLGYFKQASPAARRAALRELLSDAPSQGGNYSQQNSGANAVQIGAYGGKVNIKKGG